MLRLRATMLRAIRHLAPVVVRSPCRLAPDGNADKAAIGNRTRLMPWGGNFFRVCRRGPEMASEHRTTILELVREVLRMRTPT
jgi:hypothetical protein